VLFAIQGFGGIQRINKDGMKIDAYIKGKHCEASIKDICKMLKNDNPDSPLARIILAKYSIVESDLLDLFLTQTQDQKLSFWLIALMAMLTNSPSDQCVPEEREILLNANRAYKKAFLRTKCLNTLIDHLADCFTTQVCLFEKLGRTTKECSRAVSRIHNDFDSQFVADSQ
jgi:hypothetical protein